MTVYKEAGRTGVRKQRPLWVAIPLTLLGAVALLVVCVLDMVCAGCKAMWAHREGIGFAVKELIGGALFFALLGIAMFAWTLLL